MSADQRARDDAVTDGDAAADAETAGSGKRRLRRNRRLSRALAETAHPNQKLTPEEVREIRARYDDGETNTSKLAREYEVSQTTLSDVVRGLSWRHVGGPTANDRDRQRPGPGGWGDE